MRPERGGEQKYELSLSDTRPSEIALLCGVLRADDGRLRHWSAPNYRGTIYQTPRLISPPGADAEIEYLYQRSETGSVPRRCGEGADRQTITLPQRMVTQEKTKS
jgi:hypothetical protein